MALSEVWWVKANIMNRRKLGAVMLIGVFLAGPGVGKGQSLADDIQQLAMDYQKLGQLKQILSDMCTGYSVVKKGYDNIKSIAEGNFNLHQAFLDALLAVSPVVRDYVKVVNIINNEAELVKEYQAAKGYFGSGGKFSSGELDYLNTLYGNLLNGSLRNLEELTMVLTAGEMRMSDAERLAAIDRVDRDMTDKLTFLRSFDNNAAILAGQRALDENNINTMRSLYGVSN
jgi:hypothetical protein